MRLQHTFLRAVTLAVVGAALLTACASAPDIHRDANPSINLAGFRTFGYFSPLATDTGGYETVFTTHLKSATRRMMESKGYAYSEANPDLLLNFYANVQDRQEIQSTPSSMGYYGYRHGMYGGWYGGYGGYGGTDIQTINYKQGTLSIDVVDAKQKVLAWQATAEGRVSSEARKNPGPAIDAVVTDMMAPLPSSAPR